MPEKFLFHGRFHIICQFDRAKVTTQRPLQRQSTTLLFYDSKDSIVFGVSILHGSFNNGMHPWGQTK